MSLFDLFKRRSASGNKGAPAARENGDGAVQTPPRPRVTYNCKLCGVASSLRTVVYDHIRHAHPDVIDRNGNINEHREDEPRPHA